MFDKMTRGSEAHTAIATGDDGDFS